MSIELMMDLVIRPLTMVLNAGLSIAISSISTKKMHKSKSSCIKVLLVIFNILVIYLISK